MVEEQKELIEEIPILHIYNKITDFYIYDKKKKALVLKIDNSVTEKRNFIRLWRLYYQRVNKTFHYWGEVFEYLEKIGIEVYKVGIIGDKLYSLEYRPEGNRNNGFFYLKCWGKVNGKKKSYAK